MGPMISMLRVVHADARACPRRRAVRNVLGVLLVVAGCQTQTETERAALALSVSGVGDVAPAGGQPAASVISVAPKLPDRRVAQAPAPTRATPEEVSAMLAAVKAQRERALPPFDADGLLQRISAAGSDAERNPLVLDYLHRVEDLPPTERPAALERLQLLLVKGGSRP